MRHPPQDASALVHGRFMCSPHMREHLKLCSKPANVTPIGSSRTFEQDEKYLDKLYWHLINGELTDPYIKMSAFRAAQRLLEQDPNHALALDMIDLTVER